MTALLMHKLRLLIESEETQNAKALRDCTAVLKELTALTKEYPSGGEDRQTGVVILSEVGKAE